MAKEFRRVHLCIHSRASERTMLRLFALKLLHAAHLTYVAVVMSVHAFYKRWLLSPLPRTLQKIPSHVGLVVESCADRVERQQAAALIGWCAAAGVRCITLCDVNGDLKPEELRDGLRESIDSHMHEQVHLLSAGEPPPGSKSAIAVRVIALRTGRDDLVQAARRLCARVRTGELTVDAVDEAAVDAELTANSGFPEPVRAPALQLFARSSTVSQHL